jgi:hypothetical protein
MPKRFALAKRWNKPRTEALLHGLRLQHKIEQLSVAINIVDLRYKLAENERITLIIALLCRVSRMRTPMSTMASRILFGHFLFLRYGSAGRHPISSGVGRSSSCCILLDLYRDQIRHPAAPFARFPFRNRE